VTSIDRVRQLEAELERRRRREEVRSSAYLRVLRRAETAEADTERRRTVEKWAPREDFLAVRARAEAAEQRIRDLSERISALNETLRLERRHRYSTDVQHERDEYLAVLRLVAEGEIVPDVARAVIAKWAPKPLDREHAGWSREAAWFREAVRRLHEQATREEGKGDA
jgi:hypothetical protein